MIIIMDFDECRCGLEEFYENVAKRMGISVTGNTRFDCRKILTTRAVQECIWDHYIDEGKTTEHIGMLLLSFGPKASLEVVGVSPAYLVEVQDGFITSESSLQGLHEW